MATKARLTSDDLLQMEGEVRAELVNGELVEMTPAGARHGELVVELCSLLRNHVKQHGGGKVVGGDAGFVLKLPYDPDRVRGADIAFISSERLPARELPEKFFQGAPDLAVEILSPSEKSTEVQQKILDYLGAGARLVWLIAPQTRTATIYRANGSISIVRESEILEGEDVLPGFSLILASLFE